jgi:hypothetical protein
VTTGGVVALAAAVAVTGDAIAALVGTDDISSDSKKTGPMAGFFVHRFSTEAS